MNLSVVVVLALAGIHVVYGSPAMQTDWSGGPGIEGPVPVWDDCFDSGLPVNWYSSQGDLELEFFPSYTVINGYLDDPGFVEPVDIENDGDIDLLVTGLYGPGRILFFENSASGSEWSSIPVELGLDQVNCARVGYFNDDVLPDVIANVKEGYNNHLVLYLCESQWTWQKITLSEAAHYERDMCPADLDGDGDMDFVCSIPGWAWLGWYENLDGTGTSWNSHLLFTNYNDLEFSEAVDYDYDGDIDVLLVPSYFYNIILLENNGQGDFTDHQVSEALLNYPSCAATGDVDGDGDLDIVTSLVYEEPVLWFEQASPMEWTKHSILPSEFEYSQGGIGCSDFDSDGDMDVYANKSKEGSVYWYENLDGSGNSWFEHYVDWCAGAHGCCSADFNNDDRPDIATAAEWSEQVRWIDVTGYPEAGILESSILYLGSDPVWDSISWTGYEPKGTSISFQLRASDDSEDMGAWSDTIFSSSSLSGVLENGDSYLQYRVILLTDYCRDTPILNEVSITWDPVGVAENLTQAIDSPESFMVSSNPAASPSMIISIPNEAPVTISVFDLSGRLINKINASYPSGVHQIFFSALPSGTYQCVAESEGISRVMRFVVIR